MHAAFFLRKHSASGHEQGSTTLALILAMRLWDYQRGVILFTVMPKGSLTLRYLPQTYLPQTLIKSWLFNVSIYNGSLYGPF